MVKTVILVAGLILILSAGFVIASWDRAAGGVKILNDDDYEDMKYSEPTYKDGDKIKWSKSVNQNIIKEDITKQEWNNIFQDYRNGDISKDDTIKIINRVEIKW